MARILIAVDDHRLTTGERRRLREIATRIGLYREARVRVGRWLDQAARDGEGVGGSQSSQHRGRDPSGALTRETAIQEKKIMPRKRKPTRLREIEGNPGKRRLPAEPDFPRVTAPECPADLRGVARQTWHALAALLTQAGILTCGDMLALKALCETAGEADRLRKKLAKAGWTFERLDEQHGMRLRARPEAAMLADADRRLRFWLTEFGLTPAARSRVGSTLPLVPLRTPPDIAKYFGD
ncbi:MAG: phage terminase small subunit P27 family [Anaerolineales bacterium]|nr:phage terminase small subunit P27 family [Alphaproteobacteria bacterium]MCW5886778.1 phage terminase small subunit P27 family [Anaerolineales bacterium]